MHHALTVLTNGFNLVIALDTNSKSLPKETLYSIYVFNSLSLVSKCI